MDTSYYTNGKGNICLPKGKYSNIKYLVIDVDGTMTDGGIYYDDSGNEMKRFSTKDAAGFFAAKVCGIEILVLTGRKCSATERRLRELQVDYIEQGIVDKYTYLKKFMEKQCISKTEIAYIGDDLNDYKSMKLSDWVGCPCDSAEEIIEISDYVSKKKGGEGAVRDIISHLLKLRGQWKDAIRKCYRIETSGY